MYETLLLLLGGGLGSALTFLLKMLFDRTQLDRAHYQSLQRVYYEKSLEVAEKAMAQANVNIASLTLNNANQTARAQQIGDWVQHDSSVTELAARFTEKAWGEFYDLAYALPLYFDLDIDRFWSSEPINKMMACFRHLALLRERQIGLLELRPEKESDFELQAEQLAEVEKEIGETEAHALSLAHQSREIVLTLAKEIRVQMQGLNKNLAKIH